MNRRLFRLPGLPSWAVSHLARTGRSVGWAVTTADWWASGPTGGGGEVNARHAAASIRQPSKAMDHFEATPDAGPASSIDSRTSSQLRAAITARKHVAREAAALENRLLHLRREAAKTSKEAVQSKLRQANTATFDPTEHVKWREMAQASREAHKSRTEAQRRINYTHKQLNREMKNLSRQGLLHLRRTEAEKERRKTRELKERGQSTAQRRIDEMKLRAQRVRQDEAQVIRKRQESQERFQERMRMQRTERLRKDSDECSRATEALERMKHEEMLLLQQIERSKVMKHAAPPLPAEDEEQGPGFEKWPHSEFPAADPMLHMSTMHFPVAKECRLNPKRSYTPAGLKMRTRLARSRRLQHPAVITTQRRTTPAGSPDSRAHAHHQAAMPLPTHDYSPPTEERAGRLPPVGGLTDPSLPPVLSMEPLPVAPLLAQANLDAERIEPGRWSVNSAYSPSHAATSSSMTIVHAQPDPVKLPDIGASDTVSLDPSVGPSMD